MLAHLLHRYTAEENLTGTFAMGCQNRLQMPQQGGLAGTGFSAENHIFSSFDGKGYIFQRFTASGCGVGKAQIFDLEMCH